MTYRLVWASLVLVICSCSSKPKFNPMKDLDAQNDGHLCQVEVDDFITSLFGKLDKDNSKMIETKEIESLGIKIDDHSNDSKISIFEMMRNKESIMKQLDSNSDACLNAQELTKVNL